MWNNRSSPHVITDTSISVVSLFSCKKFWDIHNFMLSMQSSSVEIELWASGANEK